MENQHTTVPPTALQQLEMFVGDWLVEGENLEGAPLAANTKVTGEVAYEWMPGGYFLVCDWDRKFENGAHIGMGIISYDDATKAFSATNYDNMGFIRTYALTNEGNVWKLDGDKERATIEFNKVDRSFTEYWEIAKEGQWLPLCRLRGVVAQ